MDGVAGSGRACPGLSRTGESRTGDWGQAAPGYFTCLSTLMSCGVSTFYSPWIVDFGRRIKTSQLSLLVGNGVASNNGITEESRLHWKPPSCIGAEERGNYENKPANIFYKVGPPSDYYTGPSISPSNFNLKIYDSCPAHGQRLLLSTYLHVKTLSHI